MFCPKTILIGATVDQLRDRLPGRVEQRVRLDARRKHPMAVRHVMVEVLDHRFANASRDLRTAWAVEIRCALPADTPVERGKLGPDFPPASAGRSYETSRYARSSLHRGALVTLDELADRYGKPDVDRGERIESEFLFQSRHDHRKAQGIEPCIHQRQIVREWSQFAVVIFRPPVRIAPGPAALCL